MLVSIINTFKRSYGINQAGIICYFYTLPRPKGGYLRPQKEGESLQTASLSGELCAEYLLVALRV